ncbi:hypothetical protein DFJ58DRAFT_781762 [Suillus subalutaceus]|uniref:uncharacterized protein n=1 Tax=Suillus subalutaceus TaxID=48586 RepID=UPI001B869656|nr:uncharacterized protein DFJ58DRAFT_781762 [Suillus subalutaceus]KAG1858794.1 hypothetical protein DFJ58DRAFT_781762 [Suillus subalutaceus]
MAEPSTAHCSLYISDVLVDFTKSRKNVESAELRIGELHTPVERAARKTLRQTFSPPMKISLGVSFSLHLRHKRLLGMKTEDEDIDFDTDDIFRVSDARGKPERQEYIKFHKKIKIVVELFGSITTEQVVSSDENPELQPTTDEIIRICPRFRILVIGKTGVGKSSLINHAFGVEKALTSDDKPGGANIDTEFISNQNDKFVLHDSKGFEPGDEDNLKIVQDFIERRKNMPALKDQLYAVWLCFEIPRAGGRLLETGTEEFLTLKRKGKLGDVPVIVVFTKYDKLIDRMDRTLDESSLEGLSDNDIKKLIKNKAETELQKICIGPLKKFAGPDIPSATISTKEEHKETLARLIQETESHVRQHFALEASVMTSIAQRVDPRLKINASIEVGKRRYWKALASSTAFKNRMMRDCLNVLHTDIVTVWNFSDPHRFLYSTEFRTMMVNMVNKLDSDDERAADPNKCIVVGLSMVGTIAGIVSALAGPAAPIVVPIAAGVVLAVWVHDVYQMSHAVLQRFMSYIVNLTLVLQTLYLVSESQELTRRAIKLAVASYLKSPMSGKVHSRIQEYVRGLTLLERTDRDTLDKIFELMQLFDISAEKDSGLRVQIREDVGSLPDEPW